MKINGVEVHLYEVAHKGCIAYAYSTLPLEKVRKECRNWDSGDDSPSAFYAAWKHGVGKEITSIQDISHNGNVLEILPFETEELKLEMSIGEFFKSRE